MNARGWYAGLACLVACARAAAQVTPAVSPDGSLGTSVDLANSTYTISGGTIVDSNQFHSFDQFSLSSGETADFTGPAGIVNILGRVTGGLESSIAGTIRSSIPGANLWLINPNGVVFESGASLDVSGSFHVTTADYLLLEGGGQFSANMNAGFEPLLLVGDPVSFGFLEPVTGIFTRNVVFDGVTLEVNPGETMSFVGREVRLENGSTLIAPGGRLDLASVGSAGEITRLADGLDNSGITYSGDGERVSMTGQSTLDVSGEGGGSIYIRAGRFDMGPDEFDDETVRADTLGADDGGVIDIRARFDVGIRGLVTANSSGNGTGGDIFVSGRTIFTPDRGGGIAGPAALETQALAAGDAGSIALDATNISLGAPLRVGTIGTGAAGDVNITGVDFNIASTSEIKSSTSGPGAGGDINVIVTGRLGLNAGTFRAETTAATGGGPAGNIALVADTITNPGSDGFTISTNTRGDGAGGNILLDAATSIDLDTGMLLSDAISVGQGGSITLRAPLIDLHDNIDNTPVTLSSTTTGSGNAGRISLDGDTVRIRDGASVTASTSGPGSAGDVVIGAGLFDLQRSATVTSDSSGSTSGAAGSIEVSAGTAFVTIGAGMSVTTASDRVDNATGSIALRATDGIVIDNDDLSSAALSAVTTGAAPGGSILLEAPAVTVQDSLVRAATSGDGDAGSIGFVGSTTLGLNNAIVEAGTVGAGQGGSIALGGGLVTISDTDLLANTGAGATGDAGDIAMLADAATITHSFLEAATGTSGAGGNIALTATGILTIGAGAGGPTSITATTSGAGAGGSIVLRSSGQIVIANDDLANPVLSAVTSGAATGGSIRLDAPTVTVRDSLLQASTTGTGRAGDIAVAAIDAVLTNARLEATTSTAGTGGNVVLAADTLQLDSNASGDTRVTARTLGSGDGGQVDIAAGSLILAGAAEVTVTSDGSGRGGTATITGTDVVVGGAASLRGTTTGTGTGGAIFIDAGRVTVRESGTITATTDGPGAGGSVSIATDALTVRDDGRVLAEAAATGAGGSLTIDAGTLVVEGNGTISGATTGAGPGGTVTVTATDLLVQDSGSLSVRTDGSGAGGDILVDAGRIDVTGGGSVTAAASGTGSGGSIGIVGGELRLTDGGRVEATTTGPANGGSVRIAPGNLAMDTGGNVSVSASGSGDAGAIEVDVADSIDMRDARIESASALSNGGSVTVNAGGVIILNDSTITTSANSLSGNAGDILVGNDSTPASPAFLIMQRSAIQANAGASGGAINIFAQYILGAGNVIEAISDTGNDGEIVFDVPATDLVSVLSQLDLPILDIAALLNDRCAVSALGERSSFVVEPVGVPPAPGGYLSTGYYLPGAPPSAAGTADLPPVVFAGPVRKRGC